MGASMHRFWATDGCKIVHGGSDGKRLQIDISPLFYNG